LELGIGEVDSDEKEDHFVSLVVQVDNWVVDNHLVVQVVVQVVVDNHLVDLVVQVDN